MQQHPRSAADKPRPKSGFYGAYAKGKKWQAKLKHDGKTHYLGSFNTKQQAAAAHDKAVRKHNNGPGAVCNFGSEEEGAAAASLASSEWERENPAAQVKSLPKSGFYGVCANGKKWTARLRYDGKNHHLGSFNTKQEAAVAHDKAARHHKGSDAVCNFVSAEEGAAAASLASSEWERENPAAAPTSPPPPSPATTAKGMPLRRVAVGSIATSGGSSIYIFQLMTAA